MQPFGLRSKEDTSRTINFYPAFSSLPSPVLSQNSCTMVYNIFQEFNFWRCLEERKVYSAAPAASNVKKLGIPRLSCAAQTLPSSLSTGYPSRLSRASPPGMELWRHTVGVVARRYGGVEVLAFERPA